MASRKDTDVSLDVLDTTLYTTILDASALRAHPKQCTRCKSFDHFVSDCPFLAQEKLRAPAPSPPEQPRLPHGNSTSGSLLQDRRAATCTSENGATSAMPVNEPTYAKLAGGTTPRPIAQALPEIKLQFNPQRWRSGLRTHPDTDFVNDLLNDIEFGVSIGYQPVTRDYQIYANHFSAILNPEPVAREIERELDLNRKVGPFLIPPFTFGCYSEEALSARQVASNTRFIVACRPFSQ